MNRSLFRDKIVVKCLTKITTITPWLVCEVGHLTAPHHKRLHIHHRQMVPSPEFHFPHLRVLKFTAMISRTYHGNGMFDRTPMSPDGG